MTFVVYFVPKLITTEEIVGMTLDRIASSVLEEPSSVMPLRLFEHVDDSRSNPRVRKACSNCGFDDRA